jgi:hypothetical protein
MTTSFLAELQRAHCVPDLAVAHARFAGEPRLLALRDRLSAAVASLLADGSRLHVLVDPVLADALKSARRRDDAIELPVMLPTNEGVRRPYLLPLGDVGRDETLDFVLDLAFAEATRHPERETRGATICAFIACKPASASTVATTLSEVSRRRAVPRGQRFLRLWDPRVFELLLPLLPTRELAELTGRSAGWWWIDRGGRLASRDDVPVRELGGWTSAGVADRLASVGAINGVLNALQDAEVPFDGLPSDTAILALLARARSRWGLADDFELVQFALYGVLVGANFDDDAEVCAAMAAARDRGESCIDALTSFDESHWEQRPHA